ncbi:MAG TPA: hypothetical protein VFN21_01305, partial [Acidimicrobiales bacterium]|nr:hypothetical protein [Acidimicrobiales bacterium]
CHLGRYDEARSVFPFTPDALDRFPRDLAYTTGLQSLAYATSKLGEVELAERLYPDLLRHRHLFSCSFVTTTGSLEYGAALVSLATDRHDDAVEHLRRAIDANVRAGARYWEAEARIELAETLRSRNDNGDAAEVTELLATAADCARTNGFAGLTRRIDALD